jgi:hypothetical protein
MAKTNHTKPSEPKLSLYFKRTKLFLLNREGGELRFQGHPGTGPVPVPMWVKDTLTYKHGIVDKSIIDLTPVRQAPPVVDAVDPDRAKSASDGDEQPAKPFSPTDDTGVDASIVPEPKDEEEDEDEEEEPKNEPAPIGGRPRPDRPKGLSSGRRVSAK